MLHAIRKLAREIRKRSVWLVLAVYLTGGWIALQVVTQITDRIGLPGWTPTMALVLLAIGLPVTVATAVVQGIPGLPYQDEVDPNDLVGLTPEQVHVVPQAHPLHGVGIFTWINAVLLGVMSTALLVTSVVAYLTMWALGIGPVGSLIVQGVLDVGDPVLVADFENRTDDIGLGASLREALELDLRESGVVRVLDGTAVASALARLGREPSASLSGPLAVELARAEGVKAYVEGDVASTAGGFRLTLRIVLPPSTSPVSQFRVTVDSEAELIPALDGLAERVRAKLGESLRVIRAGAPLVEAYGPLPARSR